METDAVVIGGGVSGLACAYGLMQEGRECLLLEAQRLGGVVATRRVEGYQCELGPNVFLEKPGVRALLADLGLADQIVYPRTARYGQYLWHADRPWPLPKSFGQFVASPLIPGLDKLAVLRGGAALLLPGYLKPRADDETIARFLGRILGRRTLSRLVDTALKGVYGGNVDELSARSVFPELWRHAAAGHTVRTYLKGKTRSPVFMLRDGAGSLVDALVRRLTPARVLQGTVESVRQPSEGRIELVLSDQSRLRAREVFIATSGAASAAFLGELAPGLGAALKELRYAALVVVHCAVPRQAPIHRDGFGVLFPGGPPHRLLGVMYNSELFPHLAPADGHLLTVCFGGTGAQALCEQDDSYFARAAAEELRARLNIVAVRVLGVTRWPHAIPQHEVGHYRLVEMMRAAERGLGTLRFIGSDTGGIAVPERVLRAIAAARERREAAQRQPAQSVVRA